MARYESVSLWIIDWKSSLVVGCTKFDAIYATVVCPRVPQQFAVGSEMSAAVAAKKSFIASEWLFS